jgi:hypothetical protein
MRIGFDAEKRPNLALEPLNRLASVARVQLRFFKSSINYYFHRIRTKKGLSLVIKIIKCHKIEKSVIKSHKITSSLS